ncbi:hemerythrin domain-containing protein [Streptomyces sp. NPDC056227]|uniref:hemerythrin domain-containing protein n=1 Tax=Streptomyces sp. NPDC056227 TaxID=3345753 RepID=UPI0035DF9544
MGHSGNVIDKLMADHREVEEVFGRIQAVPGNGQQLRDLVDEVTIELVRHSVAEEQYLYPAVREHSQDGDRLADKEIEDHNRVEKILKQLEKMNTVATPKDLLTHPTPTRPAHRPRQVSLPLALALSRGPYPCGRHYVRPRRPLELGSSVP